MRTVKEKTMSQCSVIKSRLLSVFFPNCCPFCRRVILDSLDFCADCSKKLPKTHFERYTPGGYYCVAALPYTKEYADAVKRFKFRKEAYCARPFASLLLKAAEQGLEVSGFDCVSCVPMHKKELRRRGFNQSELIACAFSELSGIPFVNLLEKKTANSPQHSLLREHRAENVKNAFAAVDKDFVKGKNILLIDDIITTGSTLGECARILRKNGAQSINCAAVCTTLR